MPLTKRDLSLAALVVPLASLAGRPAHALVSPATIAARYPFLLSVGFKELKVVSSPPRVGRPIEFSVMLDLEDSWQDTSDDYPTIRGGIACYIDNGSDVEDLKFIGPLTFSVDTISSVPLRAKGPTPVSPGEKTFVVLSADTYATVRITVSDP